MKSSLANSTPFNSHRWASLLILLLQFLVACFPSSQADAAPPNGAARRPFYNVGHNPNTIAEAELALQAGANALEPDIQMHCDGHLIMYHDDCDLPPYTRVPESMEAYLDGLHQLALQYPGLALVVFDVKTPAATAAFGTQILNAIRTRFNTNGVKVNVIINIGPQSDGALFDNILARLGPREGVLIDGENDPTAIANYFVGRGYSGNIGYGNGTAGYGLPFIGPNMPTSVDRAAYMRAAFGNLKNIPYVYAIEFSSDMSMFMDAGVDGIIPDIFPPPPLLIAAPIIVLNSVLAGRPDLRLATRADNPFQPRNEAYALAIRTGTGTGAGTDANLTFTLNGSLGSSSITANTSEEYRMENGSINYVTIPSRDLGTLLSITVHNDDAGSGPAWEFGGIAVSSARWLSPVQGAFTYGAAPESVIEGNGTATFNLELLSGEPYVDAYVDPTIPAANISVPPNGRATRPWQQLFSAYTYVRDNGIIHLGGGQYKEINRIDKPCRIVRDPNYASGPARIVSPD
ncbi:MAG: hypothetical protein QOF48_272 [Verrucomicrobiota bacterium]|jgi:hypothetical protein